MVKRRAIRTLGIYVNYMAGNTSDEKKYHKW